MGSNILHQYFFDFIGYTFLFGIGIGAVWALFQCIVFLVKSQYNKYMRRKRLNAYKLMYFKS